MDDSVARLCPSEQDLIAATSMLPNDTFMDKVVRLMIDLESPSYERALNQLLAHTKYDKHRESFHEFFKKVYLGEYDCLPGIISESNYFLLKFGAEYLCMVLEANTLWEYVCSRCFYVFTDEPRLEMSFIKIIMYELYTQYISRICYDSDELQKMLNKYVHMSNYDHTEPSFGAVLEILKEREHKAHSHTECDYRCIHYDKSGSESQTVRLRISWLMCSNSDLDAVVIAFTKHKHLIEAREVIENLNSFTEYAAAIDMLISCKNAHYKAPIKQFYEFMKDTDNNEMFRYFILLCIGFILEHGIDDLIPFMELVIKSDEFCEYAAVTKKILDGMAFIKLLLFELYTKYFSAILQDERMVCALSRVYTEESSTDFEYWCVAKNCFSLWSSASKKNKNNEKLDKVSD